MSPTSRSAALIGSCAAALVVASPAAAAWTAPQELPNTAGRDPVFAAYGAGGLATIGMYGPLGLVPGTPQTPLAISSVGAGAGAVSPAPSALRDGLGAPIAVSPNGTMLAVGGPRSPLDYFGLESARSRLRAAIGPAGGALRRIPTGRIVGTATLATAVNDRGDAAVVFSRCLTTSCSRRSILATFRRRGRSFTKPVVLAKRTGRPAAAVALNARGDAIVAWAQPRANGRRDDVRTRLRRASGALTRTRVAGPTLPVPTIAVTLSRGRAGAVAWFSQYPRGGPLTVSRSTVGSRGTIGSRVVLDSATTPRGVRGPRLRAILGAGGVTTLAWTGFVNGRHVVRGALARRGVAGIETISPAGSDAQLMDLSGNPRGDALVVWATLPGAPLRGVAAVIHRRGAVTFDAPRLVLAGADASGSAAGAIASDGRAIVAGGAARAAGPNAPPVRVAQMTG
ncbi:MAG TPA: hypothetical protein VM266_12215 [Solirubrobacteraceae bacterium]|nr:hypothetical protein [Solirubrobacteraceae bacterium]